MHHLAICKAAALYALLTVICVSAAPSTASPMAGSAQDNPHQEQSQRLSKRAQPELTLCRGRDQWLRRMCGIYPFSAMTWFDTCEVDESAKSEWLRHWNPKTNWTDVFEHGYPRRGNSWWYPGYNSTAHHGEAHEGVDTYEVMGVCPQEHVCVQLFDSDGDAHITCLPAPRQWDIEQGGGTLHHASAGTSSMVLQAGYLPFEPIANRDHIVIEINAMRDVEDGIVTAFLLSRGKTDDKSRALMSIDASLAGDPDDHSVCKSRHMLTELTPYDFQTVVDPLLDRRDEIDMCLPTRARRIQKASKLLLSVSYNTILTLAKAIVVYAIYSVASLTARSHLPP